MQADHDDGVDIPQEAIDFLKQHDPECWTCGGNRIFFPKQMSLYDYSNEQIITTSKQLPTVIGVDMPDDYYCPKCNPERPKAKQLEMHNSKSTLLHLQPDATTGKKKGKFSV